MELLCLVPLAIFYIAANWTLYAKAGHPGWFSLVPILNFFVLVQISGRPLWFIILLFIPFVNIVASFMIMFGIAERFGHGVGMALGLIFLPFIFIPVLAFGDSRYRAPEPFYGYS